MWDEKKIWSQQKQLKKEKKTVGVYKLQVVARYIFFIIILIKNLLDQSIHLSLLILLFVCVWLWWWWWWYYNTHSNYDNDDDDDNFYDIIFVYTQREKKNPNDHFNDSQIPYSDVLPHNSNNNNNDNKKPTTRFRLLLLYFGCDLIVDSLLQWKFILCFSLSHSLGICVRVCDLDWPESEARNSINFFSLSLFLPPYFFITYSQLYGNDTK